MTKDSQTRADKYAAKYDAAVVGARFTATPDSVKLLAATHQKAMGDLALSVRGFMNTAGIKPIMSVLYTSFANKVYGICNKFAELTAINEATDAMVKALDNGANYDVLVSIWGLFSNLGIAPCPITTP